MHLLRTIESLLEINGIPQTDRAMLLEMQKKIKSTKEYTEEEYKQIMDIICKYSMCS